MSTDRPDVPTIAQVEQVEKADHEQLARWYRFLPSGDTSEQKSIMDRLAHCLTQAEFKPSPDKSGY